MECATLCIEVLVELVVLLRDGGADEEETEGTEAVVEGEGEADAEAEAAEEDDVVSCLLDAAVCEESDMEIG